MTRHEISVEEIKQMAERRAFINGLPLNDIVWTENGVELDISPKLIELFEFTGLSNIDFITSLYYRVNPITE